MNLSTARNTAISGLESARDQCLHHAARSRESVALGDSNADVMHMNVADGYFGDMMVWLTRLGGMGLAKFAEERVESASDTFDGIVADIVRLRTERRLAGGEEAVNV